MNVTLIKWSRIILGIFLIAYGLNQFLHFFPTSYGDMPEDTRHFIDAIAMYLPFLYIFEIIVGFILIFGIWTPFIASVLAPLSLSFLIFNFANQDFQMMWPALVVAIFNIILIIGYREKYKPLFT